MLTPPVAFGLTWNFILRLPQKKKKSGYVSRWWRQCVAESEKSHLHDHRFKLENWERRQSLNHQEVIHRKELAKYELVVAIWQWWASAPVPSWACRLGPVKTEISQLKLMRTSGAGSTYSSSRLSSLWLLVHFDTLPCLCKTVLFLQPPRGVQQWLNTPKRPYQLFYYFSRGGGGGRQGGRNTFSVRRLGENPTRPVGVWCAVIMQNLQRRLWLTSKWTRGALITQLRLPPFQGHSLYPYSSFVLYHSGPVSITYTEWIITACSPRWQQPTEVCTCGFISVKSHRTATALISHHQLGIFQ